MKRRRKIAGFQRTARLHNRSDACACNVTIMLDDKRMQWRFKGISMQTRPWWCCPIAHVPT